MSPCDSRLSCSHLNGRKGSFLTAPSGSGALQPDVGSCEEPARIEIPNLAGKERFGNNKQVWGSLRKGRGQRWQTPTLGTGNEPMAEG